MTARNDNQSVAARRGISWRRVFVAVALLVGIPLSVVAFEFLWWSAWGEPKETLGAVMESRLDESGTVRDFVGAQQRRGIAVSCDAGQWDAWCKAKEGATVTTYRWLLTSSEVLPLNRSTLALYPPGVFDVDELRKQHNLYCMSRPCEGEPCGVPFRP